MIQTSKFSEIVNQIIRDSIYVIAEEEAKKAQSKIMARASADIESIVSKVVQSFDFAVTESEIRIKIKHNELER